MRGKTYGWVMAMMLLTTACHTRQESETKSVIVKTARVTEMSTSGQEEYSFIAQPWRTSELSFRVSGPIDRLDVYAGNHYRRGSIIAEIDPRDFRIRKEKAEASCRQMEAEYHRVAALYEKENLSASQYEKTKADYVSSKAAFETAVNELADTRLVAPFDGYIGEVFIERFQEVKASQPVVTLIEIDRLKIEIYVTQDVARAAQQAGRIDISFDTEPGQTCQAQVVEVSKNTMRNNLSYLLTAMLPNADGRWLAGMSGKARLALDAADGASLSPVVPLSALCHRPVEGDYVWVVDELHSTVSRRRVTRGELLPHGQVCIREGLKAGETIATTGLRFLSDGMEVEWNRDNTNSK